VAAAAAAAINQPLKQETNSQTPFSKHIRNSKTQSNLVPKMTQNQSQEQVPAAAAVVPPDWRLLPTGCWILAAVS
jgi:hypothetical protein